MVTNVNKFDTSDVIKVHDKEITIIEGSNDTAVLITVVAVGFLILLLLLFVARYLYNKMQAEKLRA